MLTDTLAPYFRHLQPSSWPSASALDEICPLISPVLRPGSGDEAARFLWKGNGMLEITGENLARLLRGLTIAVGHRKNRILVYQFLAAEIRALHYSYGVGDSQSYLRALTFLENCKRLTLRSIVRKSAERHVEIIDNHARRILLRALKKLDASQPWETYIAVYPSERRSRLPRA